jgi:type IV fimbrial biogenesis protein FimT
MVSQTTQLRARGFTLVELLVAMTIFAILSGIAVPSLRGLIAGIRARGAASDLYASATLARSEAIKRNQEVKLAPGTSGQWKDGWSIPDPQNAGLKLDDHPAVQGATITGPTDVTFQPNGRVKGGGNPKFDVSVAGSDEHRCIRVSLSGMPSQTTGACP